MGKKQRVQRRLRPGFFVLLATCLVYFCLGYCTVRGGFQAGELAGAVQNEAVQPQVQAAAERSEEPARWNLLLVNGENPMPEDYSVTLTALRNGQQVDERMYPALQEMMDDARAAGLSPLICSSYRTEIQQKHLYEEKVEEYLIDGYSDAEAEKLAAGWVAPPGTSEHQTGLAVDIVAESYQHLDSAQEDTEEQQWLMHHCWDYGFILRYPSDKVHVTGIQYEPWHYRFVGVQAALAMRDSGRCLEEYLEEET